MPGKSAIEWCDKTWNPVTGCTKVSAGCDSCYAERFAERWRGIPGHPYEQGFDLKLWPDRLDLPLRWTKPSRIFVNSMSDLFHAGVPDEFISQVFMTMAEARRHTFQILTKRPQRMLRFLTEIENTRMLPGTGITMTALRAAPGDGVLRPWPLPNVWLGTSVENQDAAFRLDALVKTPAAVRFVSAEPLIGPLDLDKWLRRPCAWCNGTGTVLESSLLYSVPDEEVPCGDCEGSGLRTGQSSIHWVIAGGESGSGHRPAEVAWFRSLADQCREANVPFFMKQDSGFRSGHQGRIPDNLWALKQMPEAGK